MYSFLKSKRFSIVNHTIQTEGMDYSDIMDFRDKEELSRQIFSHDLNYIEQTDVIVVIAIGPNYDTATEMFVAKKSGKKAILSAKDPIQTPWTINFSDCRVKKEDELIELHHEFKANSL
jgi:hypothetical protein